MAFDHTKSPCKECAEFQDAAREIASLTAERDTLREALNKICAVCLGSDPGGNGQGRIHAMAVNALRAPQQRPPERKLCDGCDGHDCKDDCQYPMVDPFQHQRS